MNNTTLAAVLRDYSAAFAIAAESMHRLAASLEAGEVTLEDAAAEIEETFDNLQNLRPE
jgi:exonuclease VII small subunit